MHPADSPLQVTGGRPAPASARRAPCMIAGLVAVLSWGLCSEASAAERTKGRLCRPETIAPLTVDAPVVGVSDGDTLKARFTADFAYPGQQSIRLLEIDAPESGQAFGNRSKQALSALAFGKTLRFVIRGHDRYCRPLALIAAPGTADGSVNLAMVEQGLAWANREYGKDPAYRTAEDAARSARRGLWVDTNPMYPGDYRRAKRNGETVTEGGAP